MTNLPRRIRYGPHHTKLRRQLAPLVATGKATCWRCKHHIKPGEPWDLGHIDGTTRHAGPEHRNCNRSAAVGAKPPPRQATEFFNP